MQIFEICVYAFYKFCYFLKNYYYKWGYISILRFVSMPFLMWLFFSMKRGYKKMFGFYVYDFFNVISF